MHSQKRTTKFVILAAPRTGSNMLCTMLNSHSGILCHHELFNPSGIFYALELRNTDFIPDTIESRNQAPASFLSKIWRNNLNIPCVGFKMTGLQNPEILELVLCDPSIKKIILKRRNRVKTYVSRLLAEERGIWEYYNDQPIKNNGPQIEVDFDRFQQAANENEDFYKNLEYRLDASGADYCTVYYESLKDQATQTRLLDFLECAKAILTEKSYKQNPDDLKLLVRNYDKLKVQCQSSDFALDFE